MTPKDVSMLKQMSNIVLFTREHSFDFFPIEIKSSSPDSSDSRLTKYQVVFKSFPLEAGQLKSVEHANG